MRAQSLYLAPAQRVDTHESPHDEISKAAQRRIESSLSSLGNDEIFDKLFHQEVSALIEKALEQMPARTREVFLASRNDELTYQQIATKLGIPLRQVTTEIQAALQQMRHSLKDYLPMIMLMLMSVNDR